MVLLVGNVFMVVDELHLNGLVGFCRSANRPLEFLLERKENSEKNYPKLKPAGHLQTL